MPARVLRIKWRRGYDGRMTPRRRAALVILASLAVANALVGNWLIVTGLLLIVVSLSVRSVRRQEKP